MSQRQDWSCTVLGTGYWPLLSAGKPSPILSSLQRSEDLQGQAVHGLPSAVLWTATILYQCAVVFRRCCAGWRAELCSCPCQAGASLFTAELRPNWWKGVQFLVWFFSCAPSVLSTFQISQHGNASASIAVGAVIILRVTLLCIYRKSLDSQAEANGSCFGKCDFGAGTGGSPC